MYTKNDLAILWDMFCYWPHRFLKCAIPRKAVKRGRDCNKPPCNNGFVNLPVARLDSVWSIAKPLRARKSYSQRSAREWGRGKSCHPRKTLSRHFQPYKNFFLIIGPGLPSYGYDAGTSLVKAFRSGCDISGGCVGTIGDGVHTITWEKTEKELQGFAQSLKDPVCIVIQAHGMTQDGKYLVKFGDDEWIADSRLMEGFVAALGPTSPISILYISCSSNVGVIRSAGLPAGSVVIGLSDTYIIDPDVERFRRALRSEWPSDTSVVGILFTYLLMGRSPVSPRIAIVGTAEVFLDDLLRQCLGSQILPAAIGNTKTRCKALCDKIEELARDIALAPNELSIPTSDYGVALALALDNWLLQNERASWRSFFAPGRGMLAPQISFLKM